MVHCGEAGARQSVAQVANIRVIGAGGVGAQENQHGGAGASVRYHIDVGAGIHPVRARVAGDDVARLRRQPGLYFDGRRQRLHRKGGGVQGYAGRRAERQQRRHAYAAHHYRQIDAVCYPPRSAHQRAVAAPPYTRTRLIIAAEIRRVAAIARKTIGQGLPDKSSSTLNSSACAPA